MQPPEDSPPPPQIPQNLMRRRKQLYRLRRRRYLLADLAPVPEHRETTPTTRPNREETPRELPPATHSPDDREQWRERATKAEEYAGTLRAELLSMRSRLAGLEDSLQRHKHEIEDKNRFIDEARRILDDAKAQITKTHAEMESQRKRLQREKDDMRQHAAEEILRLLFSPLDHFGIAVDQFNAGGSAEALSQGLLMVHREMIGVLEQAGLNTIYPVGELFDPHLHDAVAAIHDQSRQDGIVLQVLRPGYSLKGKLLRPAMVAVNKTEDSAEKNQIHEHIDESGVPAPPTRPEPPTPPKHDRKSTESQFDPIEKARRMLETKSDS